MKPLAERVGSYSYRRDIIYRCFKCDTNFAMLGDKINYCYHCGEKVDWDGVVTRLEKSFEEIWSNSGLQISIEEFEKEFIDELNVQQIGEDFTKLYNEDKSPKSCDQCVYALDYESCAIAESERETIAIPRRLNKCHSAICTRFKEKEK